MRHRERSREDETAFLLSQFKARGGRSAPRGVAEDETLSFLVTCLEPYSYVTNNLGSYFQRKLDEY